VFLSFVVWTAKRPVTKKGATGFIIANNNMNATTAPDASSFVEGIKPHRKLRPLVISMGPPRQDYIQQLFSHHDMERDFEPPVFVPGVPSRGLRNRNEFFRYANEAGLLPELEWKALATAAENPDYVTRPESFFECLKDIPITTLGRRGGAEDVKIHYSKELWRKAKTLTRERAVLACFMAHLIAMKRLTTEGFDFILEDNVRAPTTVCGRRILDSIEASNEWQQELEDASCHLRFFGWLGSTANLEWIFQKHIYRASYVRLVSADIDMPSACSMFTFPLTSEIERDLEEEEQNVTGCEKVGGTSNGTCNKQHSKPGGNPIWGAYAYWISSQGLDQLLGALRNDVGALLWKHKRQRHYTVKPIDKVLPRRIMDMFGHHSVHLATQPAFFRAPMLTSKIHAKWDPEFCKSTTLQLKRTGLGWNDLWLTKAEQTVVAYHKEHDTWLTLSQCTAEEGEPEDPASGETNK
jgi:hypothetical protein